MPIVSFRSIRRLLAYGHELTLVTRNVRGVAATGVQPVDPRQIGG